jgi:hypothetical protein
MFKIAILAAFLLSACTSQPIRYEVKEVNTLSQVQALAAQGWEPYASFNDSDANQHMLRRRVN